jgi:hypothetical protein
MAGPAPRLGARWPASAVHSQTVDTDYAEQTSNLTRYQVLREASVKVLKIVNQNTATALDLLAHTPVLCHGLSCWQ